jgi:hypothetical protein
MWIGDVVNYTKEEIVVIKLKPVIATVESINARDGSINLQLDNGEIVKAEPHQVFKDVQYSS